MDQAALATTVAQRWDAVTAVDALLEAIEEGDEPEALRLARSPDVKAATESEPWTRLEVLASLATSGYPALADDAIAAIRAEPRLAAARFGGKTLLHRAAAAWSVEFTALLLELGADPNARDGAGHPPLYYAGNRFPRPVGVPESGTRALVECFTAFGADLDAADGVKVCAPLHMCARRGHAALAEALVIGGANLEARDINGETPLRRAVNCSQPAVASVLLRLGADSDSHCNRGRAPRDAARTAAMRILFAG